MTDPMFLDSGWLSVYFYPGEDEGAGDRFLQDELAPWLKEMEAEGLLQRFFFIRYWERGAHVRLRLDGRSDELLAAVGQRFGLATASLADSEATFPPGSCHLGSYKAEPERYGGVVGLALAEKHFVASSHAVLAALAEHPHWGSEAALGAAVFLHLAAWRGWGFSLETAMAFAANYSRVGIQQLLQEASGESIAAAEAAFGRLFESQRERLVPFVQVLWNTLADDDAIESAWLAAWWQANRAWAEGLAAATDRGEIQVPRIWLAQPHLDHFDDRTLHIWFVGTSLIHMTNNRLGVASQDEAYLAFILNRVLAEVKE